MERELSPPTGLGTRLHLKGVVARSLAERVRHWAVSLLTIVCCCFSSRKQ